MSVPAVKKPPVVLFQPIEGALATDRSLRISPGVDIAAWAELGPMIIRLEKASKFWVGDYLVHSEWRYTDEQFRERWGYGERSRWVQEQLGVAWDDVRDYVYVCGNVPESVRDPQLSFSHHRHVAKLVPAEQELWLTRARDEGWTTRQLDEQLRYAAQLSTGTQAISNGTAAATTATETPSTEGIEQLVLSYPAERVARWRAAAAAAGLDLGSWLAAAADSAIDTANTA